MMTGVSLVLWLVTATAITAPAPVAFSTYFRDETMRVDYYHTGDAQDEIVTLDRVYRYGVWAGSVVRLLDTVNYGAYRHALYDAASGKVLYTRGFDSYFKEYQASAPAQDGVSKTFHESALLPFPKDKVVFALEKRGKEGDFQEVFRREIDPADFGVVKGQRPDPTVKVFMIQQGGDPHVKADVAIIAEGYTAAEQDKLQKDLKRFNEVFFRGEPCKSHRNEFNVYGVFKPSVESGADEPSHGSFRNTAVGTTFNSMGSERYLLTEENRALRDIASHVPYDALYIMVNHHRYGGGGIYNWYCTFTADNQWSEYLMVHEFGHSFFGLADEYYTSDVAYTDFYPPGYEPREPNITALLDPKNLKWKHLVSPGVEIPTAWEKREHDEADLAWQAERRRINDRIAELRRGGAPEREVKAVEEEYDAKDRAQSERMHRFLQSNPQAGKVGAFEGAGYASTGMYRPMVDCIMFTKAEREFCAVCREAMVRVIRSYSE